MSEVFLLYQSQVSILRFVGYGPTTLPLRHSDLLEKRMSYRDLCSRVIYGYYLPVELVAYIVHDKVCVSSKCLIVCSTYRACLSTQS